MSRDLDTSLVTESESDVVSLLVFAKLEFDSGTLYLHNGVGTFTWDTQDWIGLGSFSDVQGVREGTDVTSYEIRLVLSGLDADLLDEALNQPYQGRRATLYIGALNVSTRALVADPNQIWRGRMDSMIVTAGEENTITLTCESDMVVFDRRNGRTFSDADIQTEYSGDIWLKYLNDMEDARIEWRGGQRENYGGNRSDPGPGRRPSIPYR